MAEDTQPKEGAEETPAPKVKSAGLMPLLLTSVILAVVLGGVGFALAYFVVPARLAAANATTPAAAPTAAVPAAAAVAAAANPAAAPAAEPEKTTRSAEEVLAEGGKPVTKFTIEEVTVNIADTRGNRFVRAGVFFEADPAVLEELEANRARMIDTLGQVLSTKTLDDLTSPNIRGVLREELLGIINPTLKSGRVDNLYFTDLLVQ
jgi:flagellar FliL protein